MHVFQKEMIREVAGEIYVLANEMLFILQRVKYFLICAPTESGSVLSIHQCLVGSSVYYHFYDMLNL